jgi:hypothetical protein
MLSPIELRAPKRPATLGHVRYRLLLAVGLAVGAGCADDDSAEPATTTAAAAATSTSTPADTPAPPLEDGEHVAFLIGIDVDARTLTFDTVRFLTGQEAVDAYHVDFPDDPEGPPNDYYIVDDGLALVTMPVGADVDVQLVRLLEESNPELSEGTFEELPAYLEAYSEEGRLSYNPFRLQVDAGTVVGITEQYVP